MDLLHIQQVKVVSRSTMALPAVPIGGGCAGLADLNTNRTNRNNTSASHLHRDERIERLAAREKLDLLKHTPPPSSKQAISLRDYAGQKTSRHRIEC